MCGLGTNKCTNYFKIKLKKICRLRISDAAFQIIALIVVEVVLDKALVTPVHKIQAYYSSVVIMILLVLIIFCYALLFLK